MPPSAYLSAFRARFLRLLQYRLAALSGVVSQCWWGAIKVMVLSAFFRAGVQHSQLRLDQTIGYVWIVQGLLMLMPWTLDPDVGAAVRNGDVAIDRLRPVDTYAWWFWRAAALSLGRMLPRALLLVLLTALLMPALGLGRYGLPPPRDAFHAAWFAVSLGLAVLLSGAYMSLLNVVTVATRSERGANTLISPLVTLLSGCELPLVLFPQGAQTFLFVQPFAGLFDIPARIYLGVLPAGQVVAGVGLQALWVALFWVFGRSMLERALARLEVHGG